MAGQKGQKQSSGGMAWLRRELALLPLNHPSRHRYEASLRLRQKRRYSWRQRDRRCRPA